jgi:hypothetical protein
METDEEALSRAKSWCQYFYRSYMRMSNFPIDYIVQNAKSDCESDQLGRAREVVPQATLRFRTLVVSGVLMLFVGVGLVVLGKV